MTKCLWKLLGISAVIITKHYISGSFPFAASDVSASLVRRVFEEISSGGEKVSRLSLLFIWKMVCGEEILMVG